MTTPDPGLSKRQAAVVGGHGMRFEQRNAAPGQCGMEAAIAQPVLLRLVQNLTV